MAGERRELPGEVYVGLGKDWPYEGEPFLSLHRDRLEKASGGDFTIAAYVPEARLRVVEAKLAEARYLGDNHHNAAACPHCRPELEAERAKQRELVERAEQAEQQLRERLLSDEALTAAMGAWPAAHVPHTLRPEDYGGLGDPRLMRACREAEAQNREVAAGVIEAALDAASSSTEPATHHTAGEQGGDRG